MGAVALNADGSAGGSDEGLDIRDGIEHLGFRHIGQSVAVDLRNVEHMRALSEDPASALARLVFAALARVQNLVEHDRRGLLALADLSAQRLPLAIGRPETVPEVLRLGAGPESKDVDPAIGLAGDRIDGSGQRGAAAMPWKGVVARAALHRGDDLVGDGVVDAGGCVGGHGGNPSSCRWERG